MKIVLVVLGLLGGGMSWAQRIEEKNLSWEAGQEVFLELKYARDIRIQTWERNEVSLRVSVNLNNNTQNDAWSLVTESNSNRMKIESILDEPKTLYQGDCDGSNYRVDGRRYCSLIVYEIFVPHVAVLRVESLGGNISIQGAQSAVYAKSLSGFVDVDWSDRQGATVSMKSLTGEVYTNLDLTMERPSEAAIRRRGPVGWEIEGTVAGGGVNVKLESISNDIYFRKSGSS